MATLKDIKENNRLLGLQTELELEILTILYKAFDIGDFKCSYKHRGNRYILVGCKSFLSLYRCGAGWNLWMYRPRASYSELRDLWNNMHNIEFLNVARWMND